MEIVLLLKFSLLSSVKGTNLSKESTFFNKMITYENKLKTLSWVLVVPYLSKNQISAEYRYESITTLAILKIPNGYHKSFQIVDYTMTNIQNFSLSKIVDFRA